MERVRHQGMRSCVPRRHPRWLHERHLRERSEGRTAAVDRHPDDGEHRPDRRRRRRTVAIEDRADELQDHRRRPGERRSRLSGSSQGPGTRYARGDPAESRSRPDSRDRAAPRGRHRSAGDRVAHDPEVDTDRGRPRRRARVARGHVPGRQLVLRCARRGQRQDRRIRRRLRSARKRLSHRQQSSARRAHDAGTTGCPTRTRNRESHSSRSAC